MKSLLCLVVLWNVWFISPQRWRRRFIQPLAVITVSLIVLLSPLFLNFLIWGLTVTLPPDTGEPVDAIVVLGRGPDLFSERLVETWQLWQAERAPRVFASGMLDAKFLVRSLKKSGIPETVLAGEECSQSTEENALFTSAVLHPQGVNSILLVTDLPHMLRSWLMFRSIRFNVVPHPTPFHREEFSPIELLKRLTREYCGLISYTLTGKLRQRTPHEVNNPSGEVMLKLTDWNCQV